MAALSVCGLLATMASVPASGTDVAASDLQRGRVQLDKIDDELLDDSRATAHSGGGIEAVVVLAAEPESPSESSPRKVTTGLKSAARTSQAPVVDAIRERGDEVLNTFWIKNMILARLQPDTMRELTAYDSVDRIVPNFTVQTPPSPEPPSAVGVVDEASTWGIERIGADDVQGELGITGAGVRVAVLDTGVDAGHPDLAGKLVTDDPADPSFPGGWMEFSETGEPVPSTPHDSDFHGTHVSGTAVGGNASGTQIGVAPGARLMSGLVIPGGSGSFAQVVAGMQWAVAPFDADGNPAGPPADVVNMSLGAEGHFAEFIEPTRNMYEAGIFPAFAIGNNCAAQSSSSPGNVYEAVSVGAADSDDNVAAFSCGEVVDKSDWVEPPAEWPDSFVVPDVSAPGVGVLSALPGGTYGTVDGTSMATPHVAGTAALMIEAEPDITVDEAMEKLAGTSFFDDRHGSERPNARFGWGRIDAYAAVVEAALTSGVSGTVTDAGSDQPIVGAVVTRLDNGRAVRTDEVGRFEMRLPTGAHSLEVSHFGYAVRTLDGIVVGPDQFTEISPELTPLPRGDVTGRVTYGPTGSTVPGATVEVLDVPVELSATTARNGTYTIHGVPEGTYQVVASAIGLPGSEPVTVDVSAGSSDRSDLVLPPRVRASVGTNGAEGNEFSVDASITSDGRYVAFYSPSSNLVAGDTNGNDCGTMAPCGRDVFVHDRQTGETERVSVASDGTEGNLGSVGPSVSDDGRYVAFTSSASNLVAGDTNEQGDLFVHDRQTGETERVSVASDGTEANGGSAGASMSGDGRYVAFHSIANNLVAGDTNGQDDIFVHDRQNGTTERVSIAADGVEANAGSFEATVSADARYIAFESSATNLVAGDTNRQIDVFVFDRETRTTERVSIASDGTEPTRRVSSAAAISDDGRYVAFQSGASELVAGDTNARSDIFIHDRQTQTTERVSVATNGAQGNDNSSAASFSADGRYIVFTSGASNLIDADANGQDDVFLHDRQSGTTERISVAADGAEGNAGSGVGSVSDDGRFVAYDSSATNIEDGDTNRQLDVFVYDRRPGEPTVRFALSNLEIKPSVVRAGRHVKVSAVVKNLGDMAGRYDAVLRVDGHVEDRATLAVRPDKTAVAEFKVRQLTAGPHEVTIGPLTTGFTVLAPPGSLRGS